jgi:hypothetical protein
MLDEKIKVNFSKEEAQEFERNLTYDWAFRTYDRIRRFEQAYKLLNSRLEKEALAILSA